MLVLEFEKKRKEINYYNLSLAEINLCAINSEMDNHSEANHAVIAIKILENAHQKGLVKTNKLYEIEPDSNMLTLEG